MLTAQELKARLTDEDVFKILQKLGGEPNWLSSKGVIVSRTVCHGGQKHKLEYYCDSKRFHCYTDCGDSFDIIELVCRARKLFFNNAINYIALQVGIDTMRHGFGSFKSNKINDWDFIDDLGGGTGRSSALRIDHYDTELMNTFQDIYYQPWIDEGITIETMRKYEIKYCSLYQQIIIPHRDIVGGMFGVRCRALLDEDIERGKYRPFWDGRTLYSHPLSQNLYGLDKNIGAITQTQSIILFEGEKSVMQCDSYYGDSSIAVALCGSNLSSYQADLILGMEVKNVYVALDKQYHDSNSVEGLRWAKHIRDRIVNKLAQYCNVYIIWDKGNLLEYKASPADCGKEIFEQLMEEKIYATSASII